MNKLIMIKWGGGLITDKTEPFTAKPEVITELASELVELREAYPDAHIILGNGAGSFGHPPAKQYRLKQGAHNPEQFFGMSVTHGSVVRLNTFVIDATQRLGLPVFSMPPASFIECDNGEVSRISATTITHLLTSGCIPSVFGDTCTDPIRGTTILSTERVLAACASALKAQYQDITVIYVMKAPGVLDTAGEVIPFLGPEQDVTATHIDGHDVTGGIESKVAAARDAATWAGRVSIIGPGKGNLLRAVQGEPVGTQIRLT